eukprot:4682904-Amphidinium_carterae.2
MPGPRCSDTIGQDCDCTASVHLKEYLITYAILSSLIKHELFLPDIFEPTGRPCNERANTASRQNASNVLIAIVVLIKFASLLLAACASVLT